MHDFCVRAFIELQSAYAAPGQSSTCVSKFFCGEIDVHRRLAAEGQDITRQGALPSTLRS
jgi:hypothetical protein